jgi:hypothetical protein
MVRMRLGEKHIGLLGIDPDHQASLTAGRDRNSAADEEDEASEHRLLADVGLAGDQLTNAIGEIFVVGHARIIVYQRQRRRPGFSIARAAGPSWSVASGPERALLGRPARYWRDVKPER